MLGLYLWWGKPRLVTSRSRLSLVVVPKAPAMASLSVVASLFAILPSPTSRFCPLALLLLQQLVPYCLLILPDRSSTPGLRPVVVLHYLHAWCPTPWIDVITGAPVRLWLQCRPTSPVVFSRNGDHTSSHSGPFGPSRANSFFCFRGACGRVWVSLLYVSMNCFLSCLRYYCLRCWARGIFPMDSGCLIFPIKR